MWRLDVITGRRDLIELADQITLLTYRLYDGNAAILKCGAIVRGNCRSACCIRGENGMYGLL